MERLGVKIRSINLKSTLYLGTYGGGGAAAQASTEGWGGGVVPHSPS